MTKEVLQSFLEEGLSQREIATNLGKSQTAVRYWVDKFGLSKLGTCVYCGSTEGVARTVCLNCKSQKWSRRWIRIKKEAIKYKGGKCSVCGYDRFYGALEFHHSNPKEKEYSWNGLKKRSWYSIMRELDKCVLLCSNCHKEEHHKIGNAGNNTVK